MDLVKSIIDFLVLNQTIFMIMSTLFRYFKT